VFCDETSYCGIDGICQPPLPDGAACDPQNICDANLYCAGLATAGGGICSPLPKHGEPCEGPCAELSDVCRDGTCVMAGLHGDPCDDDFDCSAYYTCTPAFQCGRYPTDGMPCTSRCSDGAFCSQAICVPQKTNGDTCQYNDECVSHLCDDGRCTEPVVCI
jgi:hypothetical protein